jgi:hypothetical protein
MGAGIRLSFGVQPNGLVVRCDAKHEPVLLT